MPVAASEIITKAGKVLFDANKVRWSESELLGFINDAQRQIVFLRPDVGATIGTVNLAIGSRQTIPADGIRLLRVYRNMGANGTTPGRAVREASRLALDAELPDWHTRTAAEVEHYVFDNIDPRSFYVYPSKSVATLHVEVLYSKLPTTINSAGSNLSVPDQYANTVLDYVLYRAFLKDATYAGNPQRAQMHLAQFNADLGANLQAEFASSITTGSPPMKTNMQSVNDVGAR